MNPDTDRRKTLTDLQQALANPAARTAEWTNTEFIPPAEREKNLKIMTAAQWASNILIAVLVIYYCQNLLKNDPQMQLVMVGVSVLVVVVSTFSWYRFVLPKIAAREYRFTQYRIDFQKEQLEIWKNGQKTAQHKFRSANVILPPLSGSESDLSLRQNLQRQIQNRTGFSFQNDPK
jgi:hypothetical protein